MNFAFCFFVFVSFRRKTLKNLNKVFLLPLQERILTIFLNLERIQDDLMDWENVRIRWIKKTESLRPHVKIFFVTVWIVSTMRAYFFFCVTNYNLSIRYFISYLMKVSQIQPLTLSFLSLKLIIKLLWSLAANIRLVIKQLLLTIINQFVHLK
jgi:hypothetical protein